MSWEPLKEPPESELARWDFGGRAKFLVDESLGIEVANWLRQSGWKAVFVDEPHLRGHSDEDVFAYAFRVDLVLLTHDVAFFRDDRRFPPHRNPGVIVLPGAQGNETALERALIEVVSLVGDGREFIRGLKAVIDEQQTWTIKQRNYRTGRMDIDRYKFPVHGPPLVWVN